MYIGKKLMKNNKIKLKYLLFISALIFNCSSMATGSKTIKYIYDKKSTILLGEENGGVRCYKVNGGINYMLLDKFKLGDINDNSDNQSNLSEVEVKEKKYISLLMPAKKKLLVDFSDFDIPKITSEKLSIKNMNFIANDCVSFLDVYRKITSICAMKQEFNTLNDSVICCNYIMSEILTVLQQKKTLLFLPVLIPAITKLEKTRELLPLAYIDSVLYNYEDPNELVFTLTIPQVRDRTSPVQGLTQENYLNMIVTKISKEKLPKDRARYQINLNTKSSVFDLITSENMDINIKEELLSLN
jgi:hypothetical protein